MPVLCPYCFEKLGGASPAFRCINPDPTRCSVEEDHALARYQRLPPQRRQRVVAAGRRLLGGVDHAVCACGLKTTKRVCHACHNELPAQFCSMDGFSIALVGAKEVGKSNYIAVLVNELEHRVGRQFQWSLSAMDDQTRKRYRADFGRYLYDMREVVPMTDSARVRADVRYPLAYSLSMEQRVLGLVPTRQVTSLVFFDTAGEDLRNVDLMSTEARYVASSQGLIFLLDPLQIQSVRDQLRGSVELPQEAHDPLEILERVTQLIRESRGLSPSRKIDTKVAVAFSKIDAVRALVDGGSAIHYPSSHPGRFNVTDAERMHANMRAHLDQWTGDRIDRFLRSQFKSYSYFGVSALGGAPAGGRLPMGVAPFRVEDPLLWMLHGFGVIRGGREA